MSSQSLGKVLTTVPEGVHIHKTLAAHPRCQEGDVRERRGLRLGDRRGARLRQPDRRRAAAFACRARTAAAAPSASATRSGSTSRPARNTSRCATSRAVAASRSATARFANSACSASNMAIRSPTRRRWCCGKRSSAISPTARRSSSTSSSPPAKPSGCARAASSCCCRTASKGQGPEHSSARLERYLQLCAEDNLQVANCTTPANYFHILRRQMRRDFRKPLIMMTPKSLLRHKLAVSSAADFTGESHFRRILSDLNPPPKARRSGWCCARASSPMS